MKRSIGCLDPWRLSFEKYSTDVDRGWFRNRWTPEWYFNKMPSVISGGAGAIGIEMATRALRYERAEFFSVTDSLRFGSGLVRSGLADPRESHPADQIYPGAQVQAEQRMRAEGAGRSGRAGRLSGKRPHEQGLHDSTSSDSRFVTDGRTLCDWLELSWLYPDGFRMESLEETASAFVVTGHSLVYSFLKPLHSSESSSDRFRRACQIVLDHQYLAPDLFLGVRLLTWVDGEPTWLPEIPAVSLGAYQVDPDADEIVLVQRRVPQEARLSQLLQVDDELSLEQLEELSARLLRFYRRQMRTVTAIGAGSLSAVQSLHRRLRVIEQFVADYASLLDPLSSVALERCGSFLTSFFTNRIPELEARERRGCWIDGHGNLFAKNVLVQSLVVEGRRGSFIERAARPNRRCDLLSEVASLVVDLEVCGASHLGTAFRERLLAGVPTVRDDRWYQFYCVLAATERVIDLFEHDEPTDHLALSRALSVAVRASFSLPPSFGIVVVGSLRGAESVPMRLLAESVAELGGMENVVHSALPPVLPGYEPLRDTVFERVLLQLRAALAESRPVLLQWDCSEEELFRLRTVYASFGAPWIVVRFDEVVPNSDSEISLVAQPELAFDVFEQLARASAARTRLAASRRESVSSAERSIPGYRHPG